MNKNDILGVLLKTKISTDILEVQNPILKKRGLDFGFKIIVRVGGRNVDLIIGFNKHFPNQAPSFFLEDRSKFEHIPHIEDDGLVCYSHDENLALDFNNPCGIISFTYESVLKTLSDGFEGKNKKDFTNEFGAHWDRLKNGVQIFSNLKISNQVEKIKIGIRDKAVIAVSDDNERLGSLNRFVSKKENAFQLMNGIFIPLDKVLSLMPPPPEFIFNLTNVHDLIFTHVDEEKKKAINKTLRGGCGKIEYVVLSILQPNGNWTQFGFRFLNIKTAKHPLIDIYADCKVEPIKIFRFDKEYLVTRGGSGNIFFERKGIVIGSGAVGSFVSEELVRSGILNLAIIDKEKMAAENIYRHSAGWIYVDKNKSDVLKEKLESYYPHANIESYPSTIEDIIDGRKINFNDYDFVVIATGNMAANNYLNRFFRNNFKGKPIIYGWLDPYGIGGHCLITNLEGDGCYNCLYENDDLHNAVSFTDKEQPQPFTKSISGCGSVYIPYGSLDAGQTANLVVRKTLAILQGKEIKNAIYSWKGCSELFLAEGFKLGKRFFMSDDELIKSKYLFYNPYCKCCGK